MPERIQRKRSRGWKMPENTICVDRTSKWGNPHTIEDYVGTPDECRAAACRDFRADLRAGRLPFTVEDIKRELAGKNLACWCPPTSPCHANILLGYANRPEEVIDGTEDHK